MRANPCATYAEQARELGLQVGDTIQGREEVGDGWHEARITLCWIGTTNTAWIVSGRSSRPREGGAWSPPHEATYWDLSCRDWQRIETPPEHVALLPPAPDAKAIRAATVAEVRAADAEISEAALQAEYRTWWMASYGAPPNAQAVSVAAAWGRHLLSLGLRRLQGEAP
jgi:hypothetical protein